LDKCDRKFIDSGVFYFQKKQILPENICNSLIIHLKINNMKAIIYAGIGLFSAASVYGVVDFYQTQKSGKLKGMYDETSAPLASERTIEAEDYSRGKIDEPMAENISTTLNEKKNTDNAKTNKKLAPSKKRSKAKKEVREITFKSFSRGRLVPRKIDTTFNTQDSTVEH